MADQREPRSDNLPEIVDAEVVEVAERDRSPEPAPRGDAPKASADPSSADAEYQEFLEFKRFKEWQASQGGSTGAPAPEPEKPWWKKALGLLRYKWVRRILYVLIALLLLNLAYDHYFGDRGGSSGSGTGGGAPADTLPMTAQNPQQAIRSVLNYLRAEPPEQACALFDADGRNGFATAYGAPDCETAARGLNAKITDPNAYANPKFAHDAIVESGPDAQVPGCRIQVRGGPELGTFKLTRTPQGGWTISAYALTSSACP
ncbi:hypothetical protein [Saccharopolyspora dendranthemae]|uniref:hypothetical protein n=1 Tax=Saccharopolyspora dendranthemae TaxID=1181886 RepID=UPI0011A2578B|nr:hypothetical protein [Saccharopolyspora dendranthemae]